MLQLLLLLVADVSCSLPNELLLVLQGPLLVFIIIQLDITFITLQTWLFLLCIHRLVDSLHACAICVRAFLGTPCPGSGQRDPQHFQCLARH